MQAIENLSHHLHAFCDVELTWFYFNGSVTLMLLHSQRQSVCYVGENGVIWVDMPRLGLVLSKVKHALLSSTGGGVELHYFI